MSSAPSPFFFFSIMDIKHACLNNSSPGAATIYSKVQHRPATSSNPLIRLCIIEGSMTLMPHMCAWLTMPIGRTRARQHKHIDRISSPPRRGCCYCLTIVDKKHALSHLHIDDEFSGACACPKHKAALLLSFQQQSLAILKPRPQSSWPTSTKRAASNVSDLVMEHGFCATSVASWATYASHAAAKIRPRKCSLKMAHHRQDVKPYNAKI